MSRKYKQQGYMDSERDETRARRPTAARPRTPEERAHRKGLRHAMDREANEVLRCHACGRNVQGFGSVVHDTACPNCNAPLHCCRACSHFDSSARWECRAVIPQRVSEKGKANQCSAYSPRLVLDATGKRTNGGGRASGGNNPRSAFNDLFKS